MSNLEESSPRYRVHPFRHQVGGHHAVGRISNSHLHLIAKPLDSNSQEFSFYEQIDHIKSLEQFVPKYHGVASVQFDEDSGSESSELDGAHSQFLEEECITDVSSEKWQRSGAVTRSNIANPWSLHLYGKKLKQTGHSASCIILEDLTSRFRFPCVLDVKMGQRAYGDDASVVKRERSIKKSASTTSASLGIRFCGMQVYNPSAQCYQCQNKYAGRAITTENAQDTLSHFFSVNNGSTVSPRSMFLADAFLRVLKRLCDALSTLEGCRFYSSSLLLIYEGDPSTDTPELDVRMIDFAHTSVFHANHGDNLEGVLDPDKAGPDENLIFGVRNLLRMLEKMRNPV